MDEFMKFYRLRLVKNKKKINNINNLNYGVS